MNRSALRSPFPLIITISLLVFIVPTFISTALIPRTNGWSTPVLAAAPQDTKVLTLISFIAQVRNGEAQQVTGIYIQDILALPVIQQPKNSPAYVSTASDVATQFGMASQFDTLGFLAHNYLAGEAFFDVIVDDILYVIYGDGHYERFQVDQIRRFQALQPASVYSDFLDLATKTKFSASDLFYETYGTGDRLILQTCIAVGKQDSWGRLFVIAVPYTPPGASNYPSLIQLQK